MDKRLPRRVGPGRSEPGHVCMGWRGKAGDSAETHMHGRLREAKEAIGRRAPRDGKGKHGAPAVSSERSEEVRGAMGGRTQDSAGHRGVHGMARATARSTER